MVPAVRVVALFGLGALLASAVVLTHGRAVGLALGVVATVATACALPGGWTRRFAFTAGWALLLAYVLAPRPSGGFLVGSTVQGYVVLGLGLGLVLYGIVTVRPWRPLRPLGGRPSTSEGVAESAGPQTHS